MLLGLHCSIRPGYLAALEEAEALGCEALQIFAYRRHEEPTLDGMRAFRRARLGTRVRRLLVHARYVPFLAFSDPSRQARSVELLARELSLAGHLGAEDFILHGGVYSIGAGPEEGLRRFVEGALRAVERASESGSRLRLLLENVPGGNRRLGGSLEELARMVEGIASALNPLDWPVGVCLDTAHAWSAGYDVGSGEGMSGFLEEVRRTVGLASVQALHLNDSLIERGSHRENHCHWGEGRLGVEGLKVLLADPALSGRPAIVETPKESGRDRANLDFVKRCQPPSDPF